MPWVFENLLVFLLEPCCSGVPQPVQCLPQWQAPFLIPGRIATRVASAVAVPALDSMDAAPRGSFPDFCFISRPVALEVFAVIRQLCQVVAFDVMQCIG